MARQVRGVPGGWRARRARDGRRSKLDKLHDVGSGAGSAFGARMAPRAQGTHKGEESSRVYAIVRCGGRQEKVALDDVLTVDKLTEAEEGATVTFPALLV